MFAFFPQDVSPHSSIAILLTFQKNFLSSKNASFLQSVLEKRGTVECSGYVSLWDREFVVISIPHSLLIPINTHLACTSCHLCVLFSVAGP